MARRNRTGSAPSDVHLSQGDLLGGELPALGGSSSGNLAPQAATVEVMANRATPMWVGARGHEHVQPIRGGLKIDTLGRKGPASSGAKASSTAVLLRHGAAHAEGIPVAVDGNPAHRRARQRYRGVAAGTGSSPAPSSVTWHRRSGWLHQPAGEILRPLNPSRRRPWWYVVPRKGWAPAAAPLGKGLRAGSSPVPDPRAEMDHRLVPGGARRFCRLTSCVGGLPTAGPLHIIDTPLHVEGEAPWRHQYRQPISRQDHRA